MSRFLFVNQFVPPDPAPTARLLGDVAEELARRGHEIVLVGDRSDYRGGKTLLGSRSLREAVALLRLFVRVSLAKRSGAIVCLTSPPLLPVVAKAALWRHAGARLIHWAMDLYPDVAVALGEVREGSRLHRLTARAMASVYRRCDLVIALDSEMAERIGPGPGECLVQAPWPPATPSRASSPRKEETRSPETRTFRWLYSGNLGRAHEWETLLEAQAILERGRVDAELVFQGGGAERQRAMETAADLGLTRCLWLPYAAEPALVASLLEADALVVTQRPETAGCLWPSKLALASLLGRPILWVGETEGQIAAGLSEKGHFVFAPGASAALASRIKNLAQESREPDLPMKVLAEKIEAARQLGISRVADAVEHCVHGLQARGH